MVKKLIEPHVLDADEWRQQAQTLATAAVRLAEQVAADYGVELELIRTPSVELRVKGRPFRVGGGIDDPQREPVELFYARRLAADALSFERVLGRRIDKTVAALPEPERAALGARLAAA